MSGADPAVTVTPATFEAIAGFLHARAGIALTEAKLYLIESRLRPVIQFHGIATLAELAAQLAGKDARHEAVAAAVVEAMTTNETFFFRDDKPFAHLRTVALPSLHRARPPGQPLRIWSAASSSGQEAYSIAMIIAEMQDMLADRPFELIGTDVSREQIERANSGVYSHFEVQRGLPIQMLVKYFDRGGKSWRVKQHLRERVSFRAWNLLDDPSRLGRFDIVFCRNVLIYFDQPTKCQVLAGLAGQMADDGFLYLGGAETTVGIPTPFVSHPGEAAFRLASTASRRTRQRPETILSTS